MAKLLEDRHVKCNKLDELLEKANTTTEIPVKQQRFSGLCTCACACATGPTGPGRYPANKDEKIHKYA